MSDKYATVLITSDADKLWRCENFRRLQPKYIGKVPPCAGMPIRIAVNRAEKSAFCDADAMWPVHPDDSQKIFPYTGKKEYKVCSHQVDCD